jgi:hypothetical protein
MNRARIAACLAACLATGVAAGPVLLAPAPSVAADRGVGHCLSRDERRAARAAGRAIRLSEVRAKLHIRRNEIIDARLCESPHGLRFRLTLLPRSGKVSRVTVDAATGAVIRGR